MPGRAYANRRLIGVVVKLDDAFAKELIAPSDGIGKSTFFDVLNERGLEQFLQVFQNLFNQTRNQLPRKDEIKIIIFLINGKAMVSILLVESNVPVL